MKLFSFFRKLFRRKFSTGTGIFTVPNNVRYLKILGGSRPSLGEPSENVPDVSLAMKLTERQAKNLANGDTPSENK